MSLRDVVKVKKFADNIHFMRMFYLKSSRDTSKLDVVDCVLAIMMFEMTRAIKNQTLVSKDKLPYKITHLFSTLKAAKCSTRE
jgi:hypothetical protein